MLYVIKYTDGSFNCGAGFACTLEDATRYSTYLEAENVANEIGGVFEIMTLERATCSEKDVLISLAQLADAIEAATITIDVCAPCVDFYSRRDEWERRTISIIDPAILLAQLR